MPALPSFIDLSSVGGLGFVVRGDADGDYAGFSVASAGDINGDGFDDFIVGAFLGDDGGTDAGEAYVIFGKASGFADIDLATLGAADGFVIQGDFDGDGAGRSVASAGDVNGDGYDDLIVGAPFGDDGGPDAGEAYVVFGKASGFADIDLATLPASDGFVIQGDFDGDGAGFSVASAGDVNGDGYDDLIVGAPGGDDGGSDAGEAYVIFGKAGLANIDLSSLAAADGFIIQGDASLDQAGWSVASAGDINGDGYDDLIIGAPGGDDGGTYSGEAYVIFGKASGLATIDLAALAAADGFVIQGDADYDFAGLSVASAGDINGDGYDDLIVGAPFGDDGGTYAGEAYVIFGKAGGFANIDLGALAPADGFVIQGAAADTSAGYCVASAGDVNGDGYDDLIVGAPFGDGGGINAGAAYVIYGKAGGFGSIDLAVLAPADGFAIQGDASGDGAGQSVSSAGDINGDGFDDLMIGAPRGDDGGANAGEAYVIFGSAAGFVPFPLDFDLATDISPASGATIDGAYAGDSAGVSVSSAGDINGDGFDDVIVGAPVAEYGYGAAYVLFGSATGVPDIDLAALAPADGFRITGSNVLSLTGLSVAPAGDVNGDGFDDLIVGAPYAYGYGAAYVIFGKAGGFANLDLAALAPADGFIIAGAYGAGWDVSSGDVNGDGFSDLIVGAPYDDTGSGNYSGAAYVIFGRDEDPATFGDIDLGALDPADGFAITGFYDYDRTGLSVATADVNGDGFDDMLVAAPGPCGCYGPGSTYYGKVWVVFGKETGLADVDLAALTPADGFVIFGAEEYDETGYSVASAGDINGDGFDEIVIGTPFSYDGGYYLGAAYVIFGKAGGFADIDLAALDPADGFVIHGAADYGGLGITVAGAGDVNGDGFADIIVGAPYAEYYAGASYVIFGKAGGFTDIDLSALTAADGFVISGAAPYDEAGSVSGAGDVDGDGFDDIIVGAPGAYANGYPYAGQAYIIYGRGLVVRDDAIALDEDDVAAGSLFDDNGSGVDKASRGVGLEIGEVEGSAANVGVQITLASGALLTVNSDGTYEYDPNGVFDYLAAPGSGAANIPGTDSFSYALAGGGTAMVTLTITGVDTDDRLEGTGGDNAMTAGVGSDTLNGLGGNDRLDGGAGTDLLQGRAGDDFLDGGAGIDRLRGGAGNDIYIVDDSGDVVEEVSAADGLDWVRSTASFVLPFYVENLTLTGNAAIDGTGNAAANVIRGNSAANVIDGGGGADEMRGGGGDDTYVVQDVGDKVFENNPADGTDTVLSSIGYTLSLYLENLTLTGGNAIDGTGNALDNLINGNGAANILKAEIGDDTVNGGGGDDQLFGKAGNDVLNGGNGNDQIYGGDGNDALTGGSGADGFRFDRALNAATNVDSISDFSAVEDTIFLDRDVFTAIVKGTLAAGAFVNGTSALDADDRILYDAATGQIRYDGDGAGGGDAVLFATVTPGTALTHLDFIVY